MTPSPTMPVTPVRMTFTSLLGDVAAVEHVQRWVGAVARMVVMVVAVARVPRRMRSRLRCGDAGIPPRAANRARPTEHRASCPTCDHALVGVHPLEERTVPAFAQMPRSRAILPEERLVARVDMDEVRRRVVAHADMSERASVSGANGNRVGARDAKVHGASHGVVSLASKPMPVGVASAAIARDKLHLRCVKVGGDPGEQLERSHHDGRGLAGTQVSK